MIAFLLRLLRQRGDYADYLRTPRWQRIRRRRLRWDGYRCRVCRSPSHLHVHHASYRFRGQLWRPGEWLEAWDTITLCRVCHNAVHRAQPISEFAD